MMNSPSWGCSCKLQSSSAEKSRTNKMNRENEIITKNRIIAKQKGEI